MYPPFTTDIHTTVIEIHFSLSIVNEILVTEEQNMLRMDEIYSTK